MKTVILKIFLISTFVFLLSATYRAEAQSANLTIDTGKEITLIEFFGKVESCSDYLFQYKDQDVAGKTIGLSMKNVTIRQLMDKALKGTGLTYSIMQRYILIDKKVSVPFEEIAEKKIVGTVQDRNGFPLPGVFVVEKGNSSHGVTTDLDGNYSIESSSSGEVVLIFSCLGFQTQTRSVTASSSRVDVVLEEDMQLLEEVVVVGYGVQKKINLTGAVTSTSGKVLEERPIANVAQGLQGVIPNLNISFNSGAPNTKAKINIRGNTSLNGGNALILLDGVEISDLSLVNPQDIENISVLKDAAAAAVYGARAAFGVMLITTKKGTEDMKPQVNYNNNLSWCTPARIKAMKMPRADIWTRMWNLGCEYEGTKPYFNEKFLSYLDAYIADPEHNPDVLLDIEGIQDPRHTPANPGWAFVSNTDWYSAFYRKAGFMHQHNLSITGGGKNSKYYASLGLKDQDGIFRYGNDNYKRLNGTLSADIAVTSWLDLNFSTRLNYMKNNLPNADPLGPGSVFDELYRMYPTMPVFLPNGDWAGMRQYHSNWNIIGIMANSGRLIDETWDKWYTARVDLHPVTGLSIKADYSYNTFFRKYKAHTRTFYQNYPEGRKPEPISEPNGVINNHENNIYQALNIWAEYSHTFEERHNLTLMAGYNQEEKTYYRNSLEMHQLLDNNLPASHMAQKYFKNSETGTMWRVQGTFFRLNYNYDSRYLVEMNGRYDGSSKYAKADRWAFFPSASIGWNIAREPFMKNMKNVEELKLRYSMGMLGNQVTDGFHDFMSITQAIPLDSYVFADGKNVEGLSTPSIPSLVTWEKVLTYDLGLDWSFWKNRLTGSFDWYIRDTKGMVRTVTLPATFGTTTGKENVADMRTVGWEFSINWRDRVENVGDSALDYGIGIGLSDYQATITKYDNPTGVLKDFYKGKKMGEIWGYETQGFIQDETEAELMNEAQKNIATKWYPGDIRYKDLNGDFYITKGRQTLDDPGDLKVIGNSTPRYRFNLTGNLGWHGFSLEIGFEGVAKRDAWMQSDPFWGFARDIYCSAVTEWHIDKVWTEDNRDAYFPRLSFSGNLKSKQIQSKYIQNAAYLRLKSATLSYDLPQKVLDNLKLVKARIYVSGLNLWEWTGLPPFMTPDIVDQIADSKIDSPNTGKEYAFMRNWSLGLNITF